MLNFIIFCFLVVFGAITAYEDLHKKKIRNKWVLFAIVFGIISSIVIEINLRLAGKQTHGLPFIAQFYLNVIFAFLFGYMLWYAGLWSAGDAKLFVAYSFIIPPTIYTVVYPFHFPSIAIIINTFLPFLVYLFFYVILKSKYAFDINFIKKIIQPKLILNLAMFVFGFAWTAQLLFKALSIQPNFFLIISVLFMMLLFATKFLKFGLLPLSLILSILRVTFDFGTLSSWDFWLNYIIMLLVLLILRFYLLGLSYELFSKELYIEDLKSGMILAEEIYKVNSNEYKKRRFVPISFIGALLKRASNNSVVASAGDGLSRKEANFIKRIHSKGFLKDHTIRVYETMPFAVFMFSGAILTFLLGCDIVIFLRGFV